MSMKSLNEGEILQKLTEGLSFPPLVFETTLLEQSAGDIGIDAVVKTSSEWGELTFGVEAKTRNTPRAFDAALRSAERIASSTEFLPLIVMPYLNEGQLAQLEQLQLSGIDLSGNGIIYVPQKILIYRTGNKNQYPDSQPTKYAYRGTTSLVARVFLAKPSYESYAEIAAEIEKRGGQVATSTISKAIKRLQSDLIVERNEDRIALLQAEKLLDKLAASYSEPKVVSGRVLPDIFTSVDIFRAKRADLPRTHPRQHLHTDHVADNCGKMRQGPLDYAWLHGQNWRRLWQITPPPLQTGN